MVYYIAVLVLEFAKEARLSALMTKNDAMGTTLVTRNGGKQMKINSEELVVGDLITLRSGYLVPADCIKIDENGPIKAFSQGSIYSNHPNFSKALVLRVGKDSNQNRASKVDIESASDDESTPLQSKIAKNAKVIGRVSLCFAIMTFMVTVIITIMETYKQIERSFDVRFL